MADGDVVVVRELYEAFNAGDLARVRELFSDEIEWVEPAGYFLQEAAGTTRGIDDVFAMFERYPEIWASFAPTPEEFYDAGGGKVFAIGTQHARTHGGTEVAASFINLWEVRDGELTVHRSWSDTKSMGEALAKG